MPDDARREWIRKVLGIDPAPQSTGPSKAELTARLMAVRDGMALIGAAETLGGDLRLAAAAVKDGNPEAAAMLGALEDRLAALTQEKRAAEAAATIKAGAASKTTGVVAFAKLRLKLKAAESAYDLAGGNLEAACTAMLATPDFIDDPKASAPETLAAVARVREQVPPIAEAAAAVGDALDGMANAAAPEARQKLAASALQAIGDYRKRLDAVPLLREMENSEAGSFAIHTALAGALDDLAAALRG
ncbi:hypothetical protein [Siccirubricoccus phaeus]|uniref:hypothetical protein n=1 Tax=Siccirubricoccus phaeus TaxID=2595053 RepID=UPI0011F121D1|nr:hypothetical protein [Siccirubricoccus phaeus]